MKHTKKIIAATLVAALSITAGLSLAACNGGTEYTFEAEQAVLADPDGAQNPLVVQTGMEWAGFDENGDPVEGEVEATHLGYFGAAADQTVTWTIKSDKACDATLTLRAASCASNMDNMDFQTWQGYITMGETECADAATLSVNGTEVELSGKLAGIDGKFTGAHAFDVFGAGMRNFSTVTANIKLKAGDNVIVLTSIGGVSMNIDKITIKASAKLTFEATDNSDRVPAQQ